VGASGAAAAATLEGFSRGHDCYRSLVRGRTSREARAHGPGSRFLFGTSPRVGTAIACAAGPSPSPQWPRSAPHRDDGHFGGHP
jgi:hypothetical protein